MGLAVLEGGSTSITEITRRCVVAPVGRLFPVQNLTAEFVSGPKP
jgi:hypothetical protein